MNQSPPNPRRREEEIEKAVFSRCLPPWFFGLARRAAVILGGKTASASPSSVFLVSASAAPKAAAARPAVWLGSSFVDSQGAAGHFFSVQVRHGLGRLIVLGHFDKGESARLAG